MSKKTFVGLLLVAVFMFVIGYVVLERNTRPTPAATNLPPTTIAQNLPPIPQFSSPLPASESVSPETEIAPGQERAETRTTSETPFSPDNPLPSVDDLLGEETDDLPSVARKLAFLVAVPALPLEERESALAHAMNLAAGNEPQIIDPLVTNPQVSDSLAETILSEALNRSLGEQADLYLNALAHRKSEALQKLIREHLAFLTDTDDLGPDPAAWQAAVAKAKQSWAE